MDFNYLHQYAEETSKELCDKFFSSKETITGQEIVGFTEVQQVNFFVLRILFEEWKKEASKLRSPFFNFEKPEVKQGLEKFMEALSFHVEVKRPDFEPLLQGAIEESILLVVAPDKFYKSILFDPNAADILKSEVLESKKYIKLNGFACDELLVKFDAQTQIDSNVFSGYLEEIFSDASKWYNRDAFLEEVNELFPLDVVQLLGMEKTIGGNTKDPVPSINDQHQQEIRTLNDELVNNKIDSLKTAFSLNQRFSFIKKLFD